MGREVEGGRGRGSVCLRVCVWGGSCGWGSGAARPPILNPWSSPIRRCGWTAAYCPVLPPSRRPLSRRPCLLRPPQSRLAPAWPAQLCPSPGLSPQAISSNKEPVSSGGQVLCRQDGSQACRILGSQITEECGQGLASRSQGWRALHCFCWF